MPYLHYEPKVVLVKYAKYGTLSINVAPWGSCSLPPGLGGLISLYSLFAIYSGDLNNEHSNNGTIRLTNF